MDNKLPLISVILPVYNVEKYLKRCLGSILSQTYKNLEILLIDDGSTDQSGQICDEFAKLDSRVRVWHKENGGVSTARNLGIEQAKGEYITFVDPDDYVDLDYVQYLYHLAFSKKCLIASCGYCIRFVEKNKCHCEGNQNQKEEILNTAQYMEKLLYGKDGAGVFIWGKIYHRSLLGDFRYSNRRIAQDVEGTYKLLRKAQIIACGYQCKYNYCIRKNSATTQIFKPMHFNLIEAADLMSRDICKWYPFLKNAVIRYQVWARFSVLNRMCSASNQYIQQRKEIIRFIKKNAGSVLKDINAPRRDKIAICMLQCGLPIYRLAWRLYCRTMR